mgnify:CR=1 FL=1
MGGETGESSLLKVLGKEGDPDQKVIGRSGWGSLDGFFVPNEIYKDLTNPASKEFEKLLNSKLSKIQIEEGKIIDGKINKITDKFVFFCNPIISPSLGPAPRLETK